MLSVALVFGQTVETITHTIELLTCSEKIEKPIFAFYDDEKEKIILFVNCSIIKTSEMRKIKKLIIELGILN